MAYKEVRIICVSSGTPADPVDPDPMGDCEYGTVCPDGDSWSDSRLWDFDLFFENGLTVNTVHGGVGGSGLTLASDPLYIGLDSVGTRIANKDLTGFDTVMVMAGGNDIRLIGGNFAGNAILAPNPPQDPVPSMQAGVAAMKANVQAQGKNLVLFTVSKTPGYALWTPAMDVYVDTYNAWLKQQTGCCVIDMATILGDADGNLLPEYQQDIVHPNGLANSIMNQEILDKEPTFCL